VRSANTGGVVAAFSSADTNKDGKLSLFEVMPSNFPQVISQLCPEPTTTTTMGLARRLQPATAAPTLPPVLPPEKALKDEGEPEGTVGFVTDQLMQILGIGDDLVAFLAQDWVPMALIGVNWGLYLSLFIAGSCQLYVVSRCFRKYRQLFEAMQRGRHEYPGHTSKEWLAQSFAEVTIFPGVLFGTACFGFLFVGIVFFVLLSVTVLLCLPFSAGLWARAAPVLLYLSLAYALKEVLRMGVMDYVLVENGDITHPATFSIFWFIQLFLNFVLGISTSALRSFCVVMAAVFSCCFVDFTLMPEQLIWMDSAYYSLLTMAYTHHERQNPIKRAMVAALFARPAKVRGAAREVKEDSCAASDEEGEEGCRAVARSPLVRGGTPGAAKDGPSEVSLRVRARFWLALTLHNNPEIRHLRR